MSAQIVNKKDITCITRDQTTPRLWTKFDFSLQIPKTQTHTYQNPSLLSNDGKDH